MKAMIIPIMKARVGAVSMLENMNGAIRMIDAVIVDANEKMLFTSTSIFECIRVVTPCSTDSWICSPLSADWDMKKPMEFQKALAKPPITPAMMTSLVSEVASATPIMRPRHMIRPSASPKAIPSKR